MIPIGWHPAPGIQPTGGNAKEEDFRDLHVRRKARAWMAWK